MEWLVCPTREESGSFNPSRVAWHLYVAQIDYAEIGKSRVRVMAELMDAGIGAQAHYITAHTQPYKGEKYGYGAGDLPITEPYYEKCFSLPLYPAMTNENVGRVIHAVFDLLNKEQ